MLPFLSCAILSDRHHLHHRVRYDGKKLLPSPSYNSVPEAFKPILQHKTQLDKVLYEAVAERWRQLVLAEGPEFQNEVKAFKALSAKLNQICGANATHPACVWYGLDDLSFFRLVKKFRASAVPFFYGSLVASTADTQ
eukprot:m.292292 g.292292  ORF g.292292 m.292292 type:complete len:138 (-) comp55111_c1_seq8:173-586(-)